MEKHYFLTWKDARGPDVSAFVNSGGEFLLNDIEQSLMGLSRLPCDLHLIKLTATKSGLEKSDDLSGMKELWKDYLPNQFAVALMSQAFRNLIESQLTGNEGIDWVSAEVKYNNEQRTYYILRFNKMLDVLDGSRTRYVDGTDHIIKACFSLDKIRKYSVFYLPFLNKIPLITSSIYVGESIRMELLRQKMTGMNFEIAYVE